MSESRSDRLQRQFHAACDLAVEEQSRLLERECGDDPELLRELCELLAEDRRGHPSLEQPAIEQVEIPTAADPQALPERIGRYRVLRHLGTGGMGVVYEAEQERPRRRVALKVIRPGLASVDHLRRFEHEAQVLGWLDHPGIARIYEAGTADTGHGPQPFFAMELIDGLPLNEYAARERLDLGARLELFARVCDALHHAHQKGIVHRDLKPANILVDATGQPRVLDFGVARVTDVDLMTTTARTRTGELIGTLRYMSPEQVAADPSQIDSRSDVYALGVIAYELLAGRPPYELDRALIHEAARIILEVEPGRLSEVDRSLAGDVETIVAKALEKDKERRYASAEELSSDIRRSLRNEPIVARAPSALYQLSKFARRNRALVAGFAGVFAALLLGLVASLVLYLEMRAAWRAETESRMRAQDAERGALEQAAAARRAALTAGRVRDFLLGMFELSEPEQARGRSLTAKELLDRGSQEIMSGLPDEPEVEATLLNTLGRVYMSLGLYEPAARHLDRSRALLEELHPEGCPDLAECLFRRGEVHHYLLQLDDAERLYRRALDMRRALFADVHPDIARSLDLLGRLLKDRGEHEAARPLLDAALAMRLRLYGDRHREVMQSHISLAMLLFSQGELDEAARFFDQAIVLCEGLPGEQDPAMPQLLFNLGVVKRSQGNLEQAGQLQEQALVLSREVFDGKHRYVALVLRELATVAYLQGRLSDSQALAGEALDVFEEADPERGAVLDLLAQMQQTRGDERDAAARFEQAIASLRESGNEAQLSITLNNFAVALRDWGRLEEAEATIREAVNLERGVHGELHVNMSHRQSNLAQILVLQGRLEEAEPHFLEAHSIWESIHGPDDAQTLRLERSLAELYQRLARPEAAEKWSSRLR